VENFTWRVNLKQTIRRKVSWKSKVLWLGVILNFLVTSCAFGMQPYGLVWGVNASSQVYFREGVSQANPQGTSWTLVDGDISYIAVGPTGQVYGWNRGGYIWYRSGITQANPKGTGWVRIDGQPMRPDGGIAVGPNGAVWGLGPDVHPDGGNIYFLEGVTESNPGGTGWKQVGPGAHLCYIAVGPGGTPVGLQHNGRIWWELTVSPANPEGTGAWTPDPQNGGLKQISIGLNNYIWGVNAGEQIWFRNGTSPTNALGAGWTNLTPGSRLNQVSIGARGAVWGVQDSGLIVMKTGITDKNPQGDPNGWALDPDPSARLVQIAVGPWLSDLSTPPAVVPTGWSEEGDAAQVVTVGSDNGETTAWAIKIEPNAQGQHNGVLYRYDNGSMDPNPWTKVIANDAHGNPIDDVADVSAASDGTVCAVSGIGQVISGGTTTTVNGVQTTTGGTVSPTGGVIYQYDEKANHWAALPTTNGSKTIMFDGVSVGNKNNIWATEANSNNVYQLVKGVWTPRSGACVDVSVGLDGTVFVIHTDDNVYEYNAKNNTLSQVSYKDASGAEHPLQLTQISVGNKDYIYGINNTNGTDDLWAWNKATNNWSRPLSTAGTPAGGFVSVGCNAAGTVMASNHEDMWISDKGGVTIDEKTAEQTSVQAQPSDKVSKHTDAKSKGKIAKPTPVAKKAAKTEKKNKKAEQAKVSAAAVAKAKTVFVQGKKVKVDSTGKIIPATTKAVGKKARAAKAATTTPATASATASTTTPETTPETQATKPEKTAKAMQSAKPAKKQVLVRQ